MTFPLHTKSLRPLTIYLTYILFRALAWRKKLICFFLLIAIINNLTHGAIFSSSLQTSLLYNALYSLGAKLTVHQRAHEPYGRAINSGNVVRIAQAFFSLSFILFHFFYLIIFFYIHVSFIFLLLLLLFLTIMPVI